MLPHQDVVAEILDLPDGPGIGALFDFDGTIISGYSATAFIQEQIRRGNLSVRELVELIGAMGSFGLGKMGFSAMMPSSCAASAKTAMPTLAKSCSARTLRGRSTPNRVPLSKRT